MVTISKLKFESSNYFQQLRVNLLQSRSSPDCWVSNREKKISGNFFSISFLTLAKKNDKVTHSQSYKPCQHVCTK